MRHIRELKTKYQIRFTDARRDPREISYSSDKQLFGRREIQGLCDELRVLW